jgi:hypothetical protein
MKLTQAQASYLAVLDRRVIANVDLSGPSRNCLLHLMHKGYADCIGMPDHRDNYWTITPAGRAALAQQGGRE